MGIVVFLAIFAGTKMKGTSISYHLLLLFICGVAMFSLSKINKLSFYHHYFKVIQEVEVRNSHFLFKVVSLSTQLIKSSIRQFIVASGLMVLWEYNALLAGVTYLPQDFPVAASLSHYDISLSPRAP